MECNFCHHQMEEGSTICPACGKDNSIREEQNPVTQEPAPQQIPEAAVPEASPADTRKQEGKKRGAGIWIGLAAIAVATGLFFAFLYPKWVDKQAFGRDEVTVRASYTQEDESALQKNRDVVVARMGSAELTNGVLQVYYWLQYYNFVNTYGSYISMVGIDTAKPLDTQVYLEQEDGTELTWQHYFLDGAIDAWAYYRAVALEAQKAGVVLDEATQAQIAQLPQQLEETAKEYGYESAAEMLEADFGPGVSMEDYVSYISDYYLGASYFNEEYAKLAVTQQEIESYYETYEEDLLAQGIEKSDMPATVDVRHILIAPATSGTDEEGKPVSTEEDWVEAEAKAQNLYEQWKAGDATEKSFATMAIDNSQDPGSVATGGMYTDVQPGQMVTEFNDWCFSQDHKPGDTGIVKTRFGYHIMYLCGVSEELYWKEQVTSLLMEDKANTLSESLVEGYETVVNYRLIQLGQVKMVSQS